MVEHIKKGVLVIYFFFNLGAKNVYLVKGKKSVEKG